MLGIANFVVRRLLCNHIFGRVTICSWTTGLRVQPFSKRCMRIRLGPAAQRGVIATIDTLIFYLLWNGSTIHEARLANTGKSVSVIEYKQNMRIVHKSDMQFSDDEYVRKSIKWYKTLFFRLIDIPVFISYVLHKQKTGQNTHVVWLIFQYSYDDESYEKSGVSIRMCRLQCWSLYIRVFSRLSYSEIFLDIRAQRWWK